MDKLIEKIRSEPLSGKDIEELNDNKIKVIKYGEIKSYDTIEELLEPHGKVIILYEFKEDYGHWCLLMETNGEIEFFDPYGNFIDDLLDMIDEKFKEESNQDYPYLSILLYKSPHKLRVNKYKFQKLRNDIASCGRHCSLRSILSELTLEEYKELFKKSKLDPDMIASYLTAYI